MAKVKKPKVSYPKFTNPVFILGAGATKACGGPLTNEILPWAFQRGANAPDREEMLARLQNFLTRFFKVDFSKTPGKNDFPDLPLLMSLLDDAIDRGHQIGDFSTDDLRDVRRWLDYAVAEVIWWTLEGGPHAGRGPNERPHQELLEPFYQQRGTKVEPVVISFNYDLVVDNTMVRLGEMYGAGFPDYVADVTTEAYRRRQGDYYGKLLKPHGSLNWMFCPACKQLDLYFDQKGQMFAKALAEFWSETGSTDPYACKGTPCRRSPQCLGNVRPVLITPTQAKDYRNPHVTRVWYEAERALQRADRVVIIGYTLPSDDVAILSMLKRDLAHLEPSKITVVGHSDVPGVKVGDHPVGQRYRWLLGPVDWHDCGFERWVKDHWVGEARVTLA